MSIILPPRHAAVIRLTWIAIAALVVVDAVWMARAAIRFPHKTLLVILSASVFLGVVSAFYRRIRRDDPIWLASQVINQMIVGSCALATFNYLGLRLDYPLMDAQFAALDRHLGFNWQAYIGWVNAHPAVAHIFTLSYAATSPEIFVMLALLCFTGRFAQFHRYALGYLLGGFVTIFIANFWPATTAYIYLHTGADAYPNLRIADATEYGQEFFAMRGHTMAVLPEIFQGLVAFPSFHSVLAILAIVAALSLSSPIARAVFVVGNVLMLLSTPVDGGHYLADTFGGILLGLIAAACAARLVPEKPPHST